MFVASLPGTSESPTSTSRVVAMTGPSKPTLSQRVTQASIGAGAPKDPSTLYLRVAWLCVVMCTQPRVNGSSTSAAWRSSTGANATPSAENGLAHTSTRVADTWISKWLSLPRAPATQVGASGMKSVSSYSVTTSMKRTATDPGSPMQP